MSEQTNAEMMKRINRLIRALEGNNAILKAYRLGGYRSPSEKAFADAECLKDGDTEKFTKAQISDAVQNAKEAGNE